MRRQRKEKKTPFCAVSLKELFRKGFKGKETEAHRQG